MSVDATPNKRTRKTKDVRRREIAQAAIKLMSKYGYHGTSVARIARAVGISNGALYQHYRNREEVLTAGIQLLGEHAHDWLVHSEGANALERLENIIDSHLTWSTQSLESFVRPTFALVGVSEAVRSDGVTPAVVLVTYDVLLPIVEEGQREGSIRADLPAADLAWAVMMYFWAEDMALLSGVQEVTAGGAGRRNFVRLLSAYAAPGVEVSLPGTQKGS